MNQAAEKENTLQHPPGWPNQKEVIEKIEYWFRDEDNPKKFARTLIAWESLKERNLDTYTLANWAVENGLLKKELAYTTKKELGDVLLCGQDRIHRTALFYSIKSGVVKLVSSSS